MRTIWKFPVDTDRFTLKMPKGAKLLSVQTQRGEPQLWALVDPAAPMVERRLATVGTGHDMGRKVDDAEFVGTFQLHCGTLVFHLFDFGETP